MPSVRVDDGRVNIC